ncbi:MerR family transcriptional regulator [Actinomadura scrupuli]|uniref:MerR family transcriptional regulator n=1 Tax=Actinomadura scrupuli TaxID=559629 RepID=UPI003D960B84
MTPRQAPDRVWRVGELARATGLTVRALHHYDRLGLLTPRRDHGDHRYYTGSDVRRLHQIMALRGFGLSLAEIAGMLDGTGADPRELVRRQLEQTEERIAAAQRLRVRLLAVMGALGHRPEPSAQEFVELIEEMTTMDRAFTPEQLEQMTQQRREMMEALGPEELAEMRRHREEAMNGLSAEQLAEMERHRRGLLPDS